ncbi:MAG TPA: GNAT family N-acetyltransferase [Vicinamibacterales bacterium]
MIVTVRSGTAADRDFVVETARRFADFGPPAWRTAAEVVAGEVRCLDEFFDGGMQGAGLLVGELNGRPAGFAFLEHHTDYFTGERHGHLGMIAVIEAAERRGIGAALLRAAEDWARTQGYPALTLNVFEGNDRARRAYERGGFAVETVRYVKRLD